MDPGFLQSDDDNSQFLRTIILEPDRDDARLVYADWLDELGDCERAEFIRIQLAIAALPQKPADIPVFVGGSIEKVADYDPVTDNIIGVVTTICCQVSDRELMAIENSLARPTLSRSGTAWISSNGVGRLNQLTSREVAVVMDDKMLYVLIADLQYVRHERERLTRVVITPQMQLDDAGNVVLYKVGATRERVEGLRRRERELLTPDNARAWTNGPWWNDKLTPTFRNSDPVMSARRKVVDHDEQFKFRFHRGFVEEAWFPPEVVKQYGDELKKSHPCRRVNELPRLLSRGEIRDYLWSPFDSGSILDARYTETFAALQDRMIMGMGIPADILRGELGLPAPHFEEPSVSQMIMRSIVEAPPRMNPAFLISPDFDRPSPMTPPDAIIPPPEPVIEENDNGEPTSE